MRNEQTTNLRASRKPNTIVKVEAQLCKQTDSGLYAWMNSRTLSVGRTNQQGENGVVEKMEECERMELLASLPTFPPAIISLNNSSITAPNKQNQGIKEVEEVG